MCFSTRKSKTHSRHSNNNYSFRTLTNTATWLTGFTVRVAKAKRHADAVMVRVGQVRGLDKLGNHATDEAADFGRRRVDPAVIDALTNLSGGCRR